MCILDFDLALFQTGTVMSDLRQMDLKSIETSVDLPKSVYAVFALPPDHPQLDANLVGHERTLPDYLIQRKSFPYFALELVTHGKGRLRLNKTEHTLQRGSVFTYGPGVAHRIESDPSAPLVKFFIDLTLQASRYDSPIHEPGLYLETNRVERMASLLQGILEDGTTGIEDVRIRQNSVRLLLDIASLDINRENPVNCPAYQNYLAARTYLEQNHHTIGSVSDLAAAMKTDPSYLSRLFKRYSSETPYHYLVRLRLSRACYLLKREEMQVQEISELLGFSDPFHFSTLFKRHMGISPRAYRDQGGAAAKSPPPRL